MTDTTNAATKRPTIASRDLIDAAGNVVTDETLATGVRYTFLATNTSEERRKWYDGNGNELPAGLAVVMCANFGWLTKAGNEVNSVKQADDWDGSDPMLAVKDFNAYLDSTPPQWGKESDGTAQRGPKYDKDVLAKSLHTCLVNSKDAQGNTVNAAKGDVAYYRAKLDDKSYYAKVRAQAAVMEQYYKDKPTESTVGLDSVA